MYLHMYLHMFLHAYSQVLFATEVIAGRDILFFDRPTSDLDAQSALSVVTALQRVSRCGRLVVITAGSLTFREYAILDRIQLLSNKGTGSIKEQDVPPSYHFCCE